MIFTLPMWVLNISGKRIIRIYNFWYLDAEWCRNQVHFCFEYVKVWFFKAKQIKMYLALHSVHKQNSNELFMISIQLRQLILQKFRSVLITAFSIFLCTACKIATSKTCWIWYNHLFMVYLYRYLYKPATHGFLLPSCLNPKLILRRRKMKLSSHDAESIDFAKKYNTNRRPRRLVINTGTLGQVHCVWGIKCMALLAIYSRLRTLMVHSWLPSWRHRCKPFPFTPGSIYYYY